MTHIWDMHGLSIRMNLSPGPALQLISISESYFAGRMHQLIIVGFPSPAMILKNAIWPMVPERTKSKIQFLHHSEVKAVIYGLCDHSVAAKIEAAMTLNRNTN